MFTVLLMLGFLFHVLSCHIGIRYNTYVLSTNCIPVLYLFYYICYICVAIMPEDHELYYGFTRFAVELNEIDQEQVHQYAPTDSRFRSDQRYDME